MTKKQKEIKTISGTKIIEMRGNRTWVTCILNDGERITVSLETLFKLFLQFDFEVEKYGKRTMKLTPNKNFGEIDYEKSLTELYIELNKN